MVGSRSPQRVQYKLAVTVNHCLENQVPTYIAVFPSPTSAVVVTCDQPLVIN